MLSHLKSTFKEGFPVTECKNNRGMLLGKCYHYRYSIYSDLVKILVNTPDEYPGLDTDFSTH